MSKFDPDFYSRYRPQYPVDLYGPLARALAARAFGPPFVIADVGCGAGQSAASLLAAWPTARVIGVDPDPAMLFKARDLCPRALFAEGSGEATGLPAAGFDAVTVGSAFHWMEPFRTREELRRILQPRGVVLVYEYQFPKSQSLPELNEWIRREFNLRWKAPLQKPRGDFASVTSCFRLDARFEVVADYKVPMVHELDADQITGLLLSQSRVLHYQSSLDPPAQIKFRTWLGEQIGSRLGGRADRFDFALQAALFAKQPDGSVSR